MKTFLFLLLFGLFEVAYANNSPSRRTLFGFLEGACSRILWNVVWPISPLSKLKLDIARKFDQLGHKVGNMDNALALDGNVYRTGLTNLALALERETPLSPHSRMVTNIVITSNGSRVSVWDSVFLVD